MATVPSIFYPSVFGPFIHHVSSIALRNISVISALHPDSYFYDPWNSSSAMISCSKLNVCFWFLGTGDRDHIAPQTGSHIYIYIYESTLTFGKYCHENETNPLICVYKNPTQSVRKIPVTKYCSQNNIKCRAEKTCVHFSPQWSGVVT